MRTRSSAAAIIAITAAALFLTGCSEQSGPVSDEPTVTGSAAPDGVETPAYDNACDGDQAVISGDGEKHDLKEGCAAVSVVAAGSTVTIGETETVMVEGSNNEITVASVDAITLMGSNNTVHVTSGTPEVTDNGVGNSVD